MLRYGLYTRKSHDDKKITEKSIREQVAEGRLLAEREGLRILWQAEESKSALVPRVRPRYAKLIRLIRNGQIDGIICWHINRLVRNMDEGGELVQLLIEGKIQEIRTPNSVYRSGDNILPLVLEAANATQSSLDLRNIVKRSHDGNFRLGGWNHKALPGYRNVRDSLNSKRGQIDSDPTRYALIRKAWELMLTGSVTKQDVFVALKQWGYRVRATLNLPERPLSYPAVAEMFRNPFYAGFVRERGMTVKGRHQPMVTPEEFQRVQLLLNRRSFTAKRRHFHAFTGLMKCAYCGQQITAECKKLKNGTDWRVYHCSDSYERCTQQGIAADKVDEHLKALFASVHIHPDALDIAASDIRRSLKEQRQPFEARRNAQEQALKALEERLARLADMWLSGLITDPARYKELESDLVTKKQEALLALAGPSDAYTQALQNLNHAVAYLKTGHLRFLSAPPERKRPIIQGLGSFHFFGREKRIELTIRPLLREIVDFAKETGRSLEHSKTGSQKQNRAAFEKQLCLGRTERSRLEPPPSLLRALQTESLADTDHSEMASVSEPDELAIASQNLALAEIEAFATKLESSKPW